MKRIDIIITDDHPVVIDGLKLSLKNDQEIQIIGTANNGKELLEKLKFLSPDIILLDNNMPFINGLESIKYIHQSKPDIKVIFLSHYTEGYMIEKAKMAGARGYLFKNASPSEIVNAIHLVYNGELSFPKKVPSTENQFEEKDEFLKQFKLTKREKEIIHLIGQDLTNQKIADKLFISVYTVETHRKAIMHKLNINKPTSLTKFILEYNL